MENDISNYGLCFCIVFFPLSDLLQSTELWPVCPGHSSTEGRPSPLVVSGALVWIIESLRCATALGELGRITAV